ncbi:hypothetical protein ACP275_11G061700 [Erythranthe tilingii]
MEENSSKRIRLVFRDEDILTETQKSDGLNRSWVLLKPYQNDTVSDVASHLLHAFQLHQSCPHGLLLSISGFVLPPFESTSILKDDEVVRVRKRRDVLSITGNNAAANEVEKLRDAEKQPVNTGVLLLANDEFEKEKGGYESDEPEEDVEGPKKRKRKAEEKIEGSKKKKRRSEATGTVEDNAPTEKLEDSLHAGENSKKKKKRSRKEIKDGSDADDRVEENEKTDKLSDENDINVEVQENGKETENGDIAPKETKKGPSRSARRKYAKRRWLREMAKIQKQNETCESEGLRNWKEDQAKKAGRKNVDGQLKVQKWKKQQVDAEMNEVDDQPKGLLHFKISPQDNRFGKGKRHQERNKRDHFLTRITYAHELRKRNGNEHEHPTQNVDGVEQPNEKQGDVQEQPGQKSDVVKELPKQNFDAPKQSNEESDEEGEIVPVVIRPGHIRFEPLGKEQAAVQQNDVPSENFQWNGITSKKKGQQWGKENRSFTPRIEYKLPSKEYSQISSHEKPKQTDKVTDFDKLPPLPSIPKEGDVIAYRLLELSSSWTPELSAHRVGKVFSFNPESNQTLLVPVPEYPIPAKISDEDADEDEDVQPDNSLYKEDGSLEIDFSLLIDVRIINNGDSGQGNKSVGLASEGSVPNEIAPETFLPSSSDKQTVVVPSSETGGASIWEEFSEALNAKKEQLSKENGWGITPKKVQPSQDNDWGSNAKKVQPPSPGNNSWGKNVRKVQPPSQDNNNHNNNNNRDKQSSGGGRSWSYKGLRGGGLASTMAMIRSKKDVWG